MLEVSDDALPHLAEMLARENQKSGIRIAVMGGGRKGPALGLVVDEARETDITIRQAELAFIIDRTLFEYCRTITIGFSSGRGETCGGSSSFLISSENPLSF